MVPAPGSAPQSCEQLQLPGPTVSMPRFYLMHLLPKGGHPSPRCLCSGYWGLLSGSWSSCPHAHLPSFPMLLRAQHCSSSRAPHTDPAHSKRKASNPCNARGKQRTPAGCSLSRCRHPKHSSPPWLPGWSHSSPTPTELCPLTQTTMGAATTSWTAASWSGAFVLPLLLLPKGCWASGRQLPPSLLPGGHSPLGTGMGLPAPSSACSYLPRAARSQ